MRNDVNVNIVTISFKEVKASSTAMRPYVPLTVFSSFKLDTCRFYLLLFTTIEYAFGVMLASRKSIST